jgi:hypothetical protein
MQEGGNNRLKDGLLLSCCSKDTAKTTHNASFIFNK